MDEEVCDRSGERRKCSREEKEAMASRRGVRSDGPFLASSWLFGGGSEWIIKRKWVGSAQCVDVPRARVSIDERKRAGGHGRKKVAPRL